MQANNTNPSTKYENKDTSPGKENQEDHTKNKDDQKNNDSLSPKK